MLSLSTEEIFAELRKGRRCVVVDLTAPEGLFQMARRDLELCYLIPSGHGFADVLPRMPQTCQKLQTLTCIRDVFQACYPRCEIVFSFDVLQHRAPGTNQTYRGLSASKTTEFACLIPLSKQKVNNGAGIIEVDVGQIVFYSTHDDVMHVNDTDEVWLGLFTSFWPEEVEPYGVYQKELMLASGKTGLFFGDRQAVVSDKKSAISPMVKKGIIGNHHVPYPLLFEFKDNRLEHVRVDYKKVEKVEEEEMELEGGDPPGVDVQKLEVVIDGLFTAVKHRTLHEDLALSSDEEEVHRPEIDMQVIANELGKQYSKEKKKTPARKVLHWSPETYPVRTAIKYKNISDDGRVMYCKASESIGQLTKDILYIVDESDNISNFTTFYVFRAFVQIGHDRSKVYEVRSRKEFCKEQLLHAVRSLFCTKRGFYVKREQEKKKKKCTKKYFLDTAAVEHDKLHIVQLYPGDRDCPFCYKKKIKH